MNNVLEITIPCTAEGFSITKSLTVTPSTTEDWATIDENGDSADSIDILFQTIEGNELFETQQYARFIVSIASDYTDDWRFHGNGTEFIEANGNSQYLVSSQVLSDTVIEVIINQVATDASAYIYPDPLPTSGPFSVTLESIGKRMEIDFRYVMKNTSTDTIYMSQDPGLSARR